jgi:hypothetical protein
MSISLSPGGVQRPPGRPSPARRHEEGLMLRPSCCVFVSDDIWGTWGRCRVISRSIAEYLVQAWDVRNSCKHNGAVLPLPSAPEGRGADGVDAMA